MPRPAKTKIEAALEKIIKAHAADKAQRTELTMQVKEGGVGTPPLPTSQEVPDAKLVNLTDADCHTMWMKEGYSAPGYNFRCPGGEPPAFGFPESSMMAG